MDARRFLGIHPEIELHIESETIYANGRRLRATWTWEAPEPVAIDVSDDILREIFGMSKSEPIDYDWKKEGF